MKSKKKYYTYRDIIAKGILGEDAIKKRFYAKDCAKWGVRYRNVLRKEKVVTAKDYEKYFTKRYSKPKQL